ncbi:hypothetical protein [Streptomyces sp. NPDC057910]|uniref:hypothetical protein n=1 Tax=Streptomyces sp. NPDC057910 TaxID=3346278 RepID=UPI0036EACF96
MTGTTVGLSLAGLALTLAIAWANFRPWWKGNRDPKALVPFGSGFLLGALSTMCTGGLLGWLSGCAPRVTNAVGDKAVHGVTGASNAAALPRQSLGTLTPDGAVLVFVVAVGVVFAWRAAGKTERKRMSGGALVGCTLCVTVGVASLLNWLPALVNDGAAQLHAALNGSGAL